MIIRKLVQILSALALFMLATSVAGQVVRLDDQGLAYSLVGDYTTQHLISIAEEMVHNESRPLKYITAVENSITNLDSLKTHIQEEQIAPNKEYLRSLHDQLQTSAQENHNSLKTQIKNMQNAIQYRELQVFSVNMSMLYLHLQKETIHNIDEVVQLVNNIIDYCSHNKTECLSQKLQELESILLLFFKNAYITNQFHDELKTIQNKILAIDIQLTERLFGGLYNFAVAASKNNAARASGIYMDLEKFYNQIYSQRNEISQFIGTLIELTIVAHRNRLAKTLKQPFNPSPLSLPGIPFPVSVQALANGCTAPYSYELLTAYACLYASQIQQTSQSVEALLTAVACADHIRPPLIADMVAFYGYWLLGRLYDDLTDNKNALAAFAAAEQILDSRLRTVKIQSDKGPARLISLLLYEQFYYEYLHILLSREPEETPAEVLKIVITILEKLRKQELTNLYNDECVVNATYTGMDELSDEHTVMLYTLTFPMRFIQQAPSQWTKHSLELFLKWPKSKEIKWISTKLDTIRLLRILRATADILRNMHRKTIYTALKTHDRYFYFLQSLYYQILKPVEVELESTTVLLYLPDNLLRLVPLIALHDGAEREFVLDKSYAVVTLPAFSLTYLKDTFRFTQSRTLLGGATGACFQPPGESVALGELTTVSLETLDTQIPGTYWELKSNFTHTALTHRLRSKPYNIMHLHTHGYFSGLDDSYLVLFSDRDRPQPGLECLQLSDSKRKLDITELEALINESEFSRSSIELLTLSACQTALGDGPVSLGLAGISIKGGAKAVLGSLWSVNETTTHVLATQFYKNLLDGMPKVNALKCAQQKVRTVSPKLSASLSVYNVVFNGEDLPVETLKEFVFDSKFDCRSPLVPEQPLLPTYWSPFILIGNWK